MSTTVRPPQRGSWAGKRQKNGQRRISLSRLEVLMTETSPSARLKER